MTESNKIKFTFYQETLFYYREKYIELNRLTLAIITIPFMTLSLLKLFDSLIFSLFDTEVNWALFVVGLVGILYMLVKFSVGFTTYLFYFVNAFLVCQTKTVFGLDTNIIAAFVFIIAFTVDFTNKLKFYNRRIHFLDTIYYYLMLPFCAMADLLYLGFGVNKEEMEFLIGYWQKRIEYENEKRKTA